MKGICIAILVCAVLMRCQTRNKDFNPFDNEFKFHQNFKLSDYDTVWGECGYWNLTNRNDGGYYQFFSDEGKIEAKGFNIDLDEIMTDGAYTAVDGDRMIQEVINRNPININQFKEKFSKFGIVSLEFLNDTTSLSFLEFVYLKDSNDSIYVAQVVADLTEVSNRVKIQRRLTYFNGRGY